MLTAEEPEVTAYGARRVLSGTIGDGGGRDGSAQNLGGLAVELISSGLVLSEFVKPSFEAP